MIRVITSIQYRKFRLPRYHKSHYSTIDDTSKKETIDIIYEDKQILVVNKCAGELCQGDQSVTCNILDDLKHLIKVRDTKPGNVYLSLVHRLDRATSGVLVFAKTSKSKSRLDKQFRDRTIKKKYICVVEGTFDSNEGVCHDKLSYSKVFGSAGGTSSIASIYFPSAETSDVSLDSIYFPSAETSDVSLDSPNERSIVSNVKSVEAKLHYTVLGSLVHKTKSNKSKEPKSISFSILDVALETGRKHQIRVQLNNTGHPILGDYKYGSRHGFKSNGIALHSYSLEIIHPVTGIKMLFKRKPPIEWNLVLGKEYEDIIKSTFFVESNKHV